jgi:serine/threonine-protein kinase/endoribonuclease IRE1
VYQGSLQGRAVAVKRLLNDFTTLALREVSLLQDADDHPNVIRYYYQEAHASFLYIALELCPASLADVVERPHHHAELSAAFVPKRALREIAAGLRHLHALKIVHRDIKPQNILVADARKGHRMLISDFGLCRKLELDQTSFLPTAGGMMGVGTFGWRAPEILRGDVKLDEAPTDENSMSSRGSTSTATSTGSAGAGAKKPTRLTKSVDIFALGCLFYYCLTSGDHPFGDRFEREVNIIKNVQDLRGLEVFGEEGAEAADLITRMLAPEAADRPDTTACLMHPYFWDAGRRLNFLQDASDVFEIMTREPRDAHLVVLEAGAPEVVGADWVARLDRLFVDNLGKFRKYDGRSVQDLLRALRNKRHHYQDLPDGVKRHVGAMPDGFLGYFTRRFPRLFLHVHRVVADSTLRTESVFRSYFTVPD